MAIPPGAALSTLAIRRSVMRISTQTIKKLSVGLIAALFIAVEGVVAIAPHTAYASAKPNQNNKNAIGVFNSSKDAEHPDENEAEEASHEEEGSEEARSNKPALPKETIESIVATIIPTQNNANSRTESAEHPLGKVQICHRTASYSNPYVVIEVATPAVDGVAGNSGSKPDHYGEHQGPVFEPSLPKHTEWGDIIPPVEGYHNGMNWTSAGQAIYENGCKTATPPEEPENPGDDEENGTDHKLTICHATGSETNPFVVITPAISAVYHAHIEHQHNEDIIPPFEYKGQTYSQNWDAKGQAIYNNDCATPSDDEDEDEGGHGGGTVLDDGAQIGPVQGGKGGSILADTGTSASIVLIAVVAGLGLLTAVGAITVAARQKSLDAEF